MKCPARKRKRKRRGWPVSASGVILPSEPPGKARVFPDTSDDFDAEGASRADSSIEPARLTHTLPLYTSLTMAGLLGKKFPTPVGMAM